MPSISEYIAVERDILQDSITLFDTKAGVLIAFSAVLIFRCLDKLAESIHVTTTEYLILLGVYKLIFVIACVFLATAIVCNWYVIRPRINKIDDLIYWGAEAFTKPEDDYVATASSTSDEKFTEDLLRFLYKLAGLCRRKAESFRRAALAFELSLGAFAIAEILRAIVLFPTMSR